MMCETYGSLFHQIYFKLQIIFQALFSTGTYPENKWKSHGKNADNSYHEAALVYGYCLKSKLQVVLQSEYFYNFAEYNVDCFMRQMIRSECELYFLSKNADEKIVLIDEG